jgi:pyruvate formate lyase activating enzyme
MKIGAFQKLSLIDYPWKISAVIFTQGCNFRCGFCHNPQLVLPELFEEQISEETVLEFLSKRKNKIEGVVITGGEPTLHNDLPDFIKKIKEFDYPVKLDTNGSNPKMLKSLIDENILDFIAMDIKTSFEKYSQLCCVDVNEQNISDSINIIKKAPVQNQFRITLLKGIHDSSQINNIEDTFGIKLHLQYFKNSSALLSNKYNESHVFQENEFLND